MKEAEEYNMRPLGYISYDGGYTWFQQWVDERGNLTERQATRVDWTFAPRIFGRRVTDARVAKDS